MPRTAIAEIVTFTLAPNVTPETFVSHAKRTEGFVRACPGFIMRRLSRGDDGRWTDLVLWRDMQAARAAAKAFAAQDCAADMMQAIDPASLHIRHEQVLWEMAAAPDAATKAA